MLDPIPGLYDHSVLSIEAERALFEAMANGDPQARHTIAEQNTRLVLALAEKFQGRGLDMDDLIGHGMIGLMIAIDRFDVARGHKFSTYATWWIRQAITRAIDVESRTIRLPVHTHDRLRSLKRAAADLAPRLGRPATLEELADHVGLTAAQAALALFYLNDADSLDRPIPGADNEDRRLADQVADPYVLEDQAMQAALGRDLAWALDRLNDRERAIIVRRFGLGGQQPQTLDEIGHDLGGVTRERIRQIERDALGKLRHVNVARRLQGYLDRPAAIAER